MRALRIPSTASAASLVLLASALACSEPAPAPATAERSEPAAAPPLVEQYEKARRDTACVDAQMLAAATELYLVSNPSAGCPADVEALVSAKMLPRVPDSAPSWTIACNDDEVVVSAPGKDGRLGTSDDVVHGGPQANCKE